MTHRNVSEHSDVPAAGPCTVDEQSTDGLTLALSRPRPGVVLVRVVGEIDLLTAPGWAQSLATAHQDLVETITSSTVDRARDDDPHPSRIVCDLTGVTFLGAAGLSVIAEAIDRAGDGAVGLWLVADTRPVRRVLHLAGLDRCVAVAARLSDAVGGPHESLAD